MFEEILETTFLDNIDYGIREDDMANLKTAYFDRNPMSLLQKALNELRQKYEKPYDQLRQAKSIKAAKALLEFANLNGVELIGLDMSVLLGGSTLYDDPRKGDVDLLVVTTKTEGDVENVFDNVSTFSDHGVEVHILVINPQEISRWCELPTHILDNQIMNTVFNAAEQATYLLSWRPVIQTDDLRESIQLARDFLSQNKLAAAISYMKTMSSVKRRKNRERS